MRAAARRDTAAETERLRGVRDSWEKEKNRARPARGRVGGRRTRRTARSCGRSRASMAVERAGALVEFEVEH